MSNFVYVVATSLVEATDLYANDQKMGLEIYTHATRICHEINHQPRRPVAIYRVFSVPRLEKLDGR